MSATRNHPLGATGAKLFATLLNEPERINGRYSLRTIIERLT